MPRNAFVLKMQRELCHPKYARKVSGLSRNRPLGSVSRKSRRLFGPEKPFVKLRPAHSVKLIFLYVVKGINIKITAKFHVTEHLRFENTKRIMSLEKFWDFRETGPWPLNESEAGLDLVLIETSLLFLCS